MSLEKNAIKQLELGFSFYIVSVNINWVITLAQIFEFPIELLKSLFVFKSLHLFRKDDGQGLTAQKYFSVKRSLYCKLFCATALDDLSSGSSQLWSRDL